jgi:hypothetical protein
MATGAAAAGAGQGAPATPGGGGNPFQLATNLYAEKNVAAVQAFTTGATQQPGGGQINAGQYLRLVRLIVRTTTAGTVATGLPAASDFPFNMLTQVDLVNVDGSEILYPMNGGSHYFGHKYSRPWLGDPATWPDAAASTILAPQFTLPLQPEVRWSAACLANTDTRSQYRVDYTVDTEANFLQGAGTGYTVHPVINVTPYLDAWAQPDANDLQGTSNQPVPPGLNLQMKRRHQIFVMNPSGSDNIFQSALTGNALRLQLLITRNATNNLRSDNLTDPILWQLDNRSLGKLSVIAGIGAPPYAAGSGLTEEWMNEFYQEYFNTALTSSATSGIQAPTAYLPYRREVGVYAFPRFIKPGSLFGQGWLYTANSTKEIFESTSAAATSNGTMELISDEVYPVGPVDPSLTDI